MKRKIKKLMNSCRIACRKLRKKDGFGINEIIGIAAGIIIAAIIVVPGLRTFTTTIMTKLTTWWTTISATLFS